MAMHLLIGSQLATPADGAQCHLVSADEFMLSEDTEMSTASPPLYAASHEGDTTWRSRFLSSTCGAEAAQYQDGMHLVDKMHRLLSCTAGAAVRAMAGCVSCLRRMIQVCPSANGR